MKLQRLYSYVRQAMDDYQMVEDGDRIAVGISGGKDSLTLLYALAGLRRFYPHPFELVALTVDLGYEGFNLSEIEDLCRTLNVEYHIIHTQIAEMVKGGECSLCARLRKGAFNEKAKELGCNKIAYAHNQDDVVETMMLSLIYEGRFSTFWPVTVLEDAEGKKSLLNAGKGLNIEEIENSPLQGKRLTVIRPLIYVPLAEVIGFRNKYNLPVVKNPCPYDRITERSYVRILLQEMNQHAPGVKKRMMTAIMGGQIPEWKVKTCNRSQERHDDSNHGRTDSGVEENVVDGDANEKNTDYQ